jgi:hypothetical protein
MRELRIESGPAGQVKVSRRLTQGFSPRNSPNTTPGSFSEGVQFSSESHELRHTSVGGEEKPGTRLKIAVPWVWLLHMMSRRIIR